MTDTTENIRRQMVEEINSAQADRAKLEIQFGQVWDSSELSKDFSVKGFMAPFVVVKRKSDNAKGSLMFQHSPRFYYDFTPDEN